ncbi:hypothetical protein AVEN_84117-1 [Araneus ventricosus]|uniref:Uncharacterized protein n=1 Tax=Araneus ventricosus TaxID=182803 RepID=A0A4Y2RY36_ARAVE|nr:hypothetical protein AVEN_84117-1 [Araneus ventricosus]
MALQRHLASNSDMFLFQKRYEIRKKSHHKVVQTIRFITKKSFCAQKDINQKHKTQDLFDRVEQTAFLLKPRLIHIHMSKMVSPASIHILTLAALPMYIVQHDGSLLAKVIASNSTSGYTPATSHRVWWLRRMASLRSPDLNPLYFFCGISIKELRYATPPPTLTKL